MEIWVYLDLIIFAVDKIAGLLLQLKTVLSETIKLTPDRLNHPLCSINQFKIKICVIYANYFILFVVFIAVIAHN